MKRIYTMIVLLAGILMTISAQPGGGWGGGSLTLSPSSATMTVGQTVTPSVSYSVWSFGGDDKTSVANTDCTWSSNDTGVATVDSNGKITAVALGSTTISVSYTTSSSSGGWGGWGGEQTYTGTFSVTVIGNPLTDAELPFITTTITDGEFAADTHWYLLKIRSTKYFYHDNGSQYGNIISLLDGTPETGEGQTRYLWCFTGTGEEGIRMHNYAAGAAYHYAATDISDANILLATDEEGADPGLYSVYNNSNGGFTFVAKSNVSAGLNDYSSFGYIAYWVDAQSMNDLGGNIEFAEVEPVDYGGEAKGPVVNETEITLDRAGLSLAPGATCQLAATIAPSDATYRSVTWTTSDNSIATVSSKGLVKGISEGTAVITATTHNKLTAQCTVKVAEVISEEDSLGEIRYITRTNGEMIAIPEKYIEGEKTEGDKVTLTLTGDTTYCYKTKDIASISNRYIGDLPKFESFKFNDKFNPNLYIDVDGEIADSDSIGYIRLNVPCISRNLTPSFKVPEGASVWVNGEHQLSKVTRRRYGTSSTLYTVAMEKNWIYRVTKTSDEVWSTAPTIDEDDQWIITPVELTSDMLSTNAPSNYGEDPVNLLDDDTSTFFQSTWTSRNTGTEQYQNLTWSSGCYYGDGVSEWPYLQIEPAEALDMIRFSYTTRNATDYAPLGLILQASNDGETWDDIKTFTTDDNLPINSNTQYTSPVINLGKSYRMLRLQLTAAQHKNYLVMSELALSSVKENPNFAKEDTTFVPQLLEPAHYTHRFVPFGRDYRVKVNYLTDRSTTEYSVPRIDITLLEDSTTSWNSNWIGMHNTSTSSSLSASGWEYVYQYANMKINGAGVWDDLEVDSIQIKGRGNSSWSQSSGSKNPYRIKCPTKIKPFGLTKGKNWVLLANKQTGSMTTNAVAMYLADMVESRGCNHIIPVELWVNGQYRGSYNFTEKVGLAKNSIDVEDESNAVLLTLDSYYEGTTGVDKFKDTSYNLPTVIKAPDFTEEDENRTIEYSDIQTAWNDFTSSLSNGEEVDQKLDLEAWARAWLVNDLVRNGEYKHPKSWYIYNKDITASDSTNVWCFGPVWDFDWAYGYDDSGATTYFIQCADKDLLNTTATTVGVNFFKTLRQYSDAAKKAYYKEWYEFMNSGQFDELISYCDDYNNFVKPSFQHNATKWSDGSAYDTQTANCKNWLTTRANFIWSNLDRYDLGPDVVDDYDFGQPTDIKKLIKDVNTPVDVYRINGVRVRHAVPAIEATQGLAPGLYIIGGKRVVVQ